MNNIKEKYDVIILGLGPAGLEASIYTSMANFKTLVLGKKENSRLSKAHLISNYFGFPKGISGKNLLEQGISQAENFGAVLEEEEAIDILKEENFIIKTSTKEYQTKTILLATGVKNTSSGIKDEEKFIGCGISFCVACDGIYFKNKKVGVLGEGDFAAKEALELLQYTKNVTIYSSGEDFNISGEYKKSLELNKIKLEKIEMKEFIGEGTLQGVLIQGNEKIDLDGMFIAKGTPKASDFAYKLGVDIINDYIKCDNKGRTNVDGIFAAGDVTGTNLQVSTAVGSGANAAFSIIEFLNKRKEE